MTSIVGVLNKHAVAVAADSAVTIGGRKVLNSANKIFALSKYEPVAIAIYNNSDLISAPWEVVIKEYRKHLCDKKMQKLEDYVNDFFDYIRTRYYFTEEEEQKEYLAAQFNRFIEAFSDEIPLGADFERLLIEKINKKQVESYGNRTPMDCFNGMSLADFSSKCNEEIDKCLQNIKTKYSCDIDKDILTNLLYSMFICDQLLFNTTGLVFVGYGESEIYPSLFSYRTYCIIDGKLSLFHDKGGDATIGRKCSAVIIPFAQIDVIHTIVRGIAPLVKDIYLDNFINPIEKLLNDVVAIVKKDNSNTSDKIEQFIKNGLQGYRTDFEVLCDTLTRRSYITPFVNSVISLDKEDLADFAESLIKLTSIKRKISPDQSTVGGPIDVMIISKGDGIIWMKRKRYFDPELNHQFLDNYYKG